MAVPRQKSGWAERVDVAAETSVGSGMFAVDDRLRVDEAEALSDGEAGTARISVRTDGDFTSADAVTGYYADRRMIVRTADSVLFDGYPVLGKLAWDRGGRSSNQAGGGGSACQEFRLVLEHVVGRLGRDVHSQIIGRHVRDSVIVDGLAVDPEAWSGTSVLVRGLPCVFNMDGVGNCDAVPIQVAGGSGAERDVYIFADDSRKDAIPWTYAKVLRYLLRFYVRAGGSVQVERVFEQTEAAAQLSSDGRETFLESDPLKYALLGQPDSLVLEATSLLEAVSLVSAASGLHLTARSTPLGRGVQTEWYVWSELSGPSRELHLATAERDETGQPLYDPATVSLADLFQDNNVSSTSVGWDARSVGETAMVVGGVRQYEVQVELRPGWLPEADLDDVSVALRSAVKENALTNEQIVAMGDSVVEDAWHRAYHRDGEEFAEHWRVGRLWVLNEAGTYDPAKYNRNAPFDSYAPYDFAAALPGRWMRRHRRLLPTATTPAGLQQVLLEVSFDGGEHWVLIDSGYEVLTDECGIWFSVANLLSVARPGSGGETNLWYALVDQECRVRVTGLVESDDRLFVSVSGQSAPTVFRNATVLYAPDRFGFLHRCEVSGGGAMAGSDDATADRDDSAIMDAVAASMAAVRGSRGVTARPVIPWLDTSYSIGDRIVGIRGRGIGFSAERVPRRRHACVIGKRYRLGGGRFETELVLASADGIGVDAT
ncbi:MAG: hypothetical protein JXQ75_07010 [Phycisphaerae bacterium]|nr:hypothetical protein [Phycisphaerae bacterium]